MSIVSITTLKDFLEDEIAKTNEDININDRHLDDIDLLKEIRILEDKNDEDLTNKEHQINLDNATLGGRRQAMKDVLMHITETDLERDTL